MTSAQHITRALNGRWHGHYATCFYLVHADACTQSLSVMDGDVERLLAYRHSDCDDRALLDALGTLKLSKVALSGFLILTPKTGAVSRPKLASEATCFACHRSTARVPE